MNGLSKYNLLLSGTCFETNMKPSSTLFGLNSQCHRRDYSVTARKRPAPLHKDRAISIVALMTEKIGMW